MATKDSKSDTEFEPAPRVHRSASVGAKPSYSRYPWKSNPVDIPKERDKTNTGHDIMRPASGSPRKFTTSLRPPSPDKCLRQRKRSNSDSLPPRLPLKEDGIQLGSVMAQEAAKSFWNPDMLYKSLQKLTEYAAQTKMMQDSKKDSDNENLDTISSEELLDSNVEEIYTLEEDTSDDLLELSDTSITGTKGRKSCDLSSSLKLHSVLTSLHSLSDHQLQQKTHANRHVFYPLSPMRRAYTDPCLSPRIMRRRKTPVISATLQVCH